MALTDNLISVWELTEASGNALDSHGTNDLTDNNTVGSGTGKIIGARDFEWNNEEYFNIASNSSLQTGDIDFTFSAWVNSESAIGAFYDAGIVAKSYDYEYSLDWDRGANRFTFKVFNTGGSGTATANNLGAPSTGTWYFIVAWHDSVNNQIGIQVNNGTANTTSHTHGVRTTTNPFRIGHANSPYEAWDGLIEQVAFWKRILTTDEKSDLYNSGNGLAYSSWAGGGGGGTAANLLIHSQAIVRASRW